VGRRNLNLQVCRSFGFYENCCPLVYTIEGTLIGDGASFVEHVRERYGKVLGVTKEIQKKRTQENITTINDEMRKKKDGLTLGEKIELALEDLKTKSCVSLIDDSFLVPENSCGNEYFTRRSNFLRDDGRKLDIVDEVLVAQRLQAELDKAEAERDRTFEEFKLENEDFIEGRLTRQRTAR
jgi:hypothetical protein